MDIEGKKFLVIGGAGFIGSHVVEELLNQDVAQVLIYDNFVRGKKANIEKFLNDKRCKIFPDGGDIRDIDILNKAMLGIDGVFHLAAMWLLHCKDYPRTAFDVNVQGTFNVLEACVQNNVKKLVYSSSASVYGDAIEIPMTENHPFNNRNFYGATKIAGEAMCRAFHDRYGLDYVGLRYMNVYGPKQDENAAYTGVIPNVLNRLLNGEEPDVNGDGSQGYDFIFVREVARSNILAMISDAKDEFINIGTGEKTTIKELCELLNDLTNANKEIKYHPYSVDDKRQYVMNRVGSTYKAQNLLNFSHKLNLREGLIELIKWRNRNVENPRN